MYWLLDYQKQEEVRQKIIDLQIDISTLRQRDQKEQIFPFVGRKDRTIASAVIEHLTVTDDLVCDPFCGSGTFAYAALDTRRRASINEWEPYAFRLSTAPFRGVTDEALYQFERERFVQTVKPVMELIYKTRCSECGHELMFEGLFFDREPEEYYHPILHERMGPCGENVIFRRGHHCVCGATEKRFDDFDFEVKANIEIGRASCRERV